MEVETKEALGVVLGLLLQTVPHLNLVALKRNPEGALINRRC